MAIEIKLPEVKVNTKESEQIINKMFSDDMAKEGMLSKILVFVKMHGPLAITDLKDKLQDYLKREVERVTIYRSSDRLVKLGILHRASAGDILVMDEQEKEPIHKHIEAKHRMFLSNMTPQFKSRFNNRNYLWINGQGEKYVEWCCKLNNFEYKKSGKKS